MTREKLRRLKQSLTVQVITRSSLNQCWFANELRKGLQQDLEHQDPIVFRNAVRKQARREDHVDEVPPKDNTTHVDRRMDKLITLVENLLLQVQQLNHNQVQQLKEQRQPQQLRQRRQQWFEDQVPTEEFAFDPIFFKEDSNNFDEAPKFDGDGHDFVEDKLVIEDDDFVIKVISHSKSPQVLEEVVVDGVIDNYPVKKVVETKVKFAATKHFCLLNDDTR
ncbi:hypothetical protein Scep_001313 [Stephania cephalantha]|uniref:Uncharacterized protein n=1 Tax=Stephania cephalantha TaxID=152367 RepID=A0AAP0L7N4_9MAGN